MFSSSIDVVDKNVDTATAYSIKRTRDDLLTPRTLDSKFTAGTNGKWSLFENEWVLSNKVKSGDTVSVVDVTGCNAVYFWDDNNIPSVFHIFCGVEQTDGAAASNKVEDAVSVFIGAQTQDHYDTLKKAIMASFSNLKDDPNSCQTDTYGQDGDFFKDIYGGDALPSGMAWKFSAKAGNQKVTRETEVRTSRQPGRF